VQELCGRRVVAFMSNNHIDPDLPVEVFILAGGRATSRGSACRWAWSPRPRSCSAKARNRSGTPRDSAARRRTYRYRSAEGNHRPKVTACDGGGGAVGFAELAPRDWPTYLIDPADTDLLAARGRARLRPSPRRRPRTAVTRLTVAAIAPAEDRNNPHPPRERHA
jgi:hypothetical protein